MQFVAAAGAAVFWADLSQFASTLGVTRIRGRIVLCEFAGVFSCQVGIQTAGALDEAPNAPVVPTTGTGLGVINAVGPVFVDFDPTNQIRTWITAYPSRFFYATDAQTPSDTANYLATYRHLDFYLIALGVTATAEVNDINATAVL